MSFVLGFVMPKVYSDAVSYESTFYFILKYHERYFSHLLRPPNTEDSKQQWKATNNEISTKQMLKEKKSRKLEAFPESIWVGGYDHRAAGKEKIKIKTCFYLRGKI